MMRTRDWEVLRELSDGGIARSYCRGLVLFYGGNDRGSYFVPLSDLQRVLEDDPIAAAEGVVDIDGFTKGRYTSDGGLEVERIENGFGVPTYDSVTRFAEAEREEIEGFFESSN